MPNYLSIGVPYERIMHGTPRKLEPYVKAFELKRKMQDRENWELGQYILCAIGSSLSKNSKYPTEPMFTDQKEKTSKSGNNEALAVIEMKKRSKILAEQGMAESPM